MPNDQFPTLHDLIANLTEYLDLTPEQQFRVTAKIKRYVHSEKAGVFNRYYLYSQGPGIFVEDKLVGHEPPADEFLNRILGEKYKQHSELAADATDEELVTWSVGTHKYKQKLPLCTECSVEVSPKVGYVGTFKDNEYVATCQPCAVKTGAWVKFNGDE